LDALPPLDRDASFWGMVITQFLGAFNDNLYKQLMLLLAIPMAAAGGALGAAQSDAQGLAQAIFALPFVLFSGPAGYLADRFSKRTVIVLSKVAEIAVMGLGLLGFLFFAAVGYQGLLLVLFLMGLQSTFFGPGKYGSLPELFRPTDLPRANGIILMTTFLAIILGTASAGGVKTLLGTDDLWVGSIFCIALAVGGTMSSLLIRQLPAASLDLRFTLASLGISRDARLAVWADRPLLAAIGASCVFWLVAGIAMPAVNSLGLVQLRVNPFLTSVMVAVIALGIAGGAVLAGQLSGGRANFRLVRIGSWGITLSCIPMALTLPGGQHAIGYVGSLCVLVLMGTAAAFFAIPLQVFIQSRPPEELKGRIIAIMNQANFVAILASGVLYSLFDQIVVHMAWPRSAIFAMMAVLMLPVALCYRKTDFNPFERPNRINQVEKERSKFRSTSTE
jgi:acyl-[acyl-carrier-protein]-phospholipid O-acyltransferase/long-chain-fatty-acid--[acyl-carrier-protein] ligase